MKSHDFYMKVLQTEQPGPYGHEFKMMVFKKGEDSIPFDDQFELMLSDFLSEYNISEVRFHSIVDSSDKLRVHFKIQDQNLALKCYQDFNLNFKTINESLRTQLFLQKPEEVFVRYADEEAKGKSQEELEQLSMKKSYSSKSDKPNGGFNNQRQDRPERRDRPPFDPNR